MQFAEVTELILFLEPAYLIRLAKERCHHSLDGSPWHPAHQILENNQHRDSTANLGVAQDQSSAQAWGSNLVGIGMTSSESVISLVPNQMWSSVDPFACQVGSF